MRSRDLLLRALLPTLVLCLPMTLVGAPEAVAAPRAVAAASGHGVHGASGAGDPYFPRQGNGGYQVRSYALHVGYTPATGQLTGLATLRGRSREALSRFDLDLRRNLHVSSVSVDGRRATFRQPARLVQELVITPARVLVAHHRFTVVVHYAGRPAPVHDPDGSLDGFIPTGDGAFVAGEPQGSPTWYPVNDTPRDKATYRISITVPTGRQAISNGRLLRVTRHAHTTTWAWLLDRPVSSYLVTATIVHFAVRTGRTPGGIPYLTAVDPHESQAQRVLRKLPAIVDYFSHVYGRYPFGQTGAIVDHAHNVGYALETATRPLFDRSPDVATLSHELAHQWYGDDVTLSRWRDIWLNEGFAEFSSWLWDEHSGGMTAAQHLQRLLAEPASDTGEWNPPPGNPGRSDEIFAGSVYDRGAGTLQALREKVGSPVFFRIMRGWLHAHAYGNAHVGQFTAYAARVAHRDLHPFFQRWLYRSGKP